MEEIKIGNKPKNEYVSACLFSFNNGHNKIMISGLGKQVSKAFDISERLCEVLENVREVETEQFEVDDLVGVRVTVVKGDIDG